MVTPYHPKRNQTLPTPDESAALQAARRDALTEATKLVSGADPLPVAWRVGWSAILSTLGRDRDGSLLASVVVNSPTRKRIYTRKIRLVRAQPRAAHGRRDLRGE